MKDWGFQKMNNFYTALDILIHNYQDRIGWTTRQIEKLEKEHAFLIQKRKNLEDRVQELRLCQKDSKLQSRQ